jgi:hypothetical protein
MSLTREDDPHACHSLPISVSVIVSLQAIRDHARRCKEEVGLDPRADDGTGRKITIPSVSTASGFDEP